MSLDRGHGAVLTTRGRTLEAVPYYQIHMMVGHIMFVVWQDCTQYSSSQLAGLSASSTTSDSRARVTPTP